MGEMHGTILQYYYNNSGHLVTKLSEHDQVVHTIRLILLAAFLGCLQLVLLYCYQFKLPVHNNLYVIASLNADQEVSVGLGLQSARVLSGLNFTDTNWLAF